MPTPLPVPGSTALARPDRDEVVHITRGLKTAMQPAEGLTDLQASVLAAITASMTGYEVDVRALEPLGPGSVDYIALDYFSMADRPIDEVRQELGITPKSDAAIVAGSRGPFEPGGISDAQVGAGRRMATSQGRAYDTLSEEQ